MSLVCIGAVFGPSCKISNLKEEKNGANIFLTQILKSVQFLVGLLKPVDVVVSLQITKCSIKNLFTMKKKLFTETILCQIQDILYV